MNPNWRKYQGALLWMANPMSTPAPTEAEVRALMQKEKAFMARWVDHFDCGTPTEWWYCLKETYSPLEELSSKQRNRIKKGLANCTVTLMPRHEAATYAEVVYQIAKDSFSDYPKQYRPAIHKEDYVRWLSNLPENQDIWLCQLNETGEYIGYAMFEEIDGYVSSQHVKVPTIHLTTQANAAIAYTTQEYYLHTRPTKCDFVLDGERPIKHQTNYQDFLIHKVNFRYAYCHLHIAYAPYIQPIIKILYPFRKIWKYLGKCNKLFYNIYCVLNMEEIHRSFKNQPK